MRTPVSRGSRGSSGNQADYSRSFVVLVHELLLLGYGRMRSVDYVNEEEPTISGCLIDEMNAVLNDPTAPARFHLLTVHDDPPVSGQGRTGKRRKRVDIRIDSLRTRPHSRFSFEAKRLGRHHPASVYLGKDGLGCFISGAYAREAPVAGMLGYVQSGTPDDWASKIQGALGTSATSGCLWRRERLVKGFNDTYCSDHDRPSLRKPVRIYHTLLVLN